MAGIALKTIKVPRNGHYGEWHLSTDAACLAMHEINHLNSIARRMNVAPVCRDVLYMGTVLPARQFQQIVVFGKKVLADTVTGQLYSASGACLSSHLMRLK